MSNELKYLVIHCSATPEGRDVKAAEVVAWHEARWGKGRIGYRTFIELDGTAVRLREANTNHIVEPNEMTFGVAGINRNAHHICYAGGMTRNMKRIKDTRTAEQLETMESIVKFYISFAPDIQVCGHNQFDNKGCPSFFVPTWLREIGIPEKNIYLRDPFQYGRFFRAV